MKLFKTNIYHDNILMSLFSYIHVVFDKTGKNWEPMQKIPSIYNHVINYCCISSRNSQALTFCPFSVFLQEICCINFCWGTARVLEFS